MGVEPTYITLHLHAPEAECLADAFTVFWPRRHERIIRQVLRAWLVDLRRDPWG